MAHSQPFWRLYYCQVNEQDQITIHSLYLKNTSFHGHPQAQKSQQQHASGPVDVELTIKQNNQIKMKLTTNAGDRFFEGERNQGMLQGYWGRTKEDIGEGNFKINLVEPKVGWNGYYEQQQIQNYMTFEQLTLGLGQELIKGKGKDEIGGFTIEGKINQNDGKVSFEKIYEEGNKWLFWGILNGKACEGSWGTQQNQERGKFKLYWLQ